MRMLPRHLRKAIEVADKLMTEKGLRADGVLKRVADISRRVLVSEMNGQGLPEVESFYNWAAWTVLKKRFGFNYREIANITKKKQGIIEYGVQSLQNYRANLGDDDKLVEKKDDEHRYAVALELARYLIRDVEVNRDNLEGKALRYLGVRREGIFNGGLAQPETSYRWALQIAYKWRFNMSFREIAKKMNVEQKGTVINGVRKMRQMLLKSASPV